MDRYCKEMDWNIDKHTFAISYAADITKKIKFYYDWYQLVIFNLILDCKLKSSVLSLIY